MAPHDRNQLKQDDIIVGEHDQKKLKKGLIAAGAMVAIGLAIAATCLFEMESQARFYLLLVSLGIVVFGGLLGWMGWHHLQNPRYFALNASGEAEWTPYFTTRKFRFEPGTRPIVSRKRLIWSSQPIDGILPQGSDSKPYIHIPESVILFRQ